MTQKCDLLTGELTRLLMEWSRLEARVPELPAGNKILPGRHPGVHPHSGAHPHGDTALPAPHQTECEGCLKAPSAARKEVLRKRLAQLTRAQGQSEAEERGSLSVRGPYGRPRPPFAARDMDFAD